MLLAYCFTVYTPLPFWEKHISNVKQTHAVDLFYFLFAGTDMIDLYRTSASTEKITELKDLLNNAGMLKNKHKDWADIAVVDWGLFIVIDMV